mmetsp:Transcript_43467/g.91312  ORF Transcript_43467/g.91312 Transcript_43467/m.91312 type:complete len:1357 (+) Transcript_43467:272-4342(+)
MTSRHQGRILRLHFTCSAPLPHGTTLRVTSSVSPPPQNDVPDDNQLIGDIDDQSSVMSGDMGFGEIGGSSYGMATRGGKFGGGGGGDGSEDLARLHSRLLQNTVEMYTTPETYPVWKTRRPVVVIDEGSGGTDGDGKKKQHNNNLIQMSALEAMEGNEEEEEEAAILLKNSSGPLMHRYRYVAVTPGATIDMALYSPKKESGDDGSASTGTGGKQTVATTPPGSDDDEDRRLSSPPETDEGSREVLQYASNHDEEDEEDDDEDFPPVLFENPPSEIESEAGSSKDGSAKKGHRKVPSLYDVQGNPVMLKGVPIPTHTADSSPSLTTTNASSFASLTISGGYNTSPVMTWEKVSALPYRTRRVEGCDAGSDIESKVEDIEIIDHWNAGTDSTFQPFWDTKLAEKEAKKEAMKGTMVTSGTNDEDEAADTLNTDDDPLEAGEEHQKESIYIVCYHLPVILSRDPVTSQWNACWSESLIAKSELHGVSSTRKTTWIGTVSNIPSQLLQDPLERTAIQTVLEGMDCIPIFFTENESLLDLMYLGFCKQVLWPSFHNVDLLDLATNGWGQRQRNTTRSDPVKACALAAAEAKERKSSAGTQAEAANAGAAPQLQSDWDQRRLDNWWNAYIKVNERFSEEVAQLVTGGDVVWVHDYHLALLPRMLREARNEGAVVGSSAAAKGRRTFVVPGSPEELAKSGGEDATANASTPPAAPVRMIFFIHVPFPTSQVFRELEHGEALLEGMLHADVVGFHAFDHARHFLNAAKRILGLTYESLMGGLIGVRHRGTKVVVTVSNVSVEADIIDALMQFPTVQDEAAALQEKHKGRSIISGIAVAQRLSGVSYKLLAFERLLTDYPVWQSKVVLLQRCLIPGARRVDEADTLREVRSLVARIRNRFGAEVIDYEEQVGSVLPIDQRLAIWTSSNVMMHAPIREGLNLSPLEYVFTRKEPAEPGVVIASEFSAVSSVLNGALRVNPYDIQMCVTSIDCALSMSFNERDARRARDIDFVSTCPSGLWTRNVLRDLNDATLESTSKMDAVGDNSPDSILAREAEQELEHLDLRALEYAYATAKKSRVIIIDFNGTLVVKEPAGKYLKREILGTSGFKPSHMTTLALQRLCSDPKNTIYVVSGDSQENLEVAVGNVPGLGLAASNGTCFSDPEGQVEQRAWQYLDFGVDWNAVKKVAMPIISKFTARTNGSFVKLSHSSIGWSYYSCDPEWGSLQASHLVTELGEALHSHDVRFVALKGIVEVVPRKGHKGHIVKKILEDARARNGDVDFVLCMGDDISDEKMFTSVINFSAGSEGENSYAFNVAVGKKPTNASFYVDDASDVGDILVLLSGDKRLLQRQTSSDGSAASEDFFA